MSEKSWIQNAVIYQIYPLTYNYSAGGESDLYHGAYGNLNGITEKADYIQSLGVDAIWICPFYKWNRNGFGYDVTDYEKVSEMFGTAEDFAKLTETFHKKGVKVLADLVLNHCSMEHEWFKKSVRKEEPYTDYFVWADAKESDAFGMPVPPNNWPSTWDSSGTSAWTWNEDRKQFYMHSFDYTMPNLNINNPAVQDKLLKIAQYWFDMGVDGFRLDGTCHYGYDPRLLDNPVIGEDTTPNLTAAEIKAERGQQMRVYDVNHELGKNFIDRIETLAKSYPEPKVLLSEYMFDKGIHANRKGRKNIRESVCDTFYTGALRGGLEDFRAGIEEMIKPMAKMAPYNTESAISPDGAKINWALSNHDMERVATRWFGENPKLEETKLAMKMLLSLPGSVCIFQGEELGLENPDVQAVKNPTNDPLGLSQNLGMPWDAARTPVPWTEAGGNMWLKPTPSQCQKAVSKQEKSENSMLTATRQAISWRKNNPVLNHVGNLQFVDTPNSKVIAFIRSNENERQKIGLAFNFTDKPARVKIPITDKVNRFMTVQPYQMIQTRLDTSVLTNQKIY